MPERRKPQGSIVREAVVYSGIRHPIADAID